MAKLANWKNPPTLEDLKADYTSAEHAHKTHVTDVDRWISNLRGDQQITPKPGRSKVVPKLIRKQAEWRYSSLSEPFLSTEELFNTNPKTFEDKQAAIQNGQVLNYQLNHQLDKVKFIDEFVRTVTDEGTAVVKIGWDYEEEEQEVDVPIVEVLLDPSTGQQVQVQTGVTTEMQMVATKNQPTLEICDYNNLVIDPTCEGDFQKAEFIIHSFETSKSALRKDGRYSNIDKIQLGSSDAITDENFTSGDDSSFEFRDEPRKKLVVYEYHGFWDYDDTGEVQSFIAAWSKDVLIRLEPSPYPFKGLPFEEVQYLPVRKSNYGQPDGELLEDNQKIVGAVTRGMLDIMGRSANGQMGIRKDALDTVNARKFERGEDYKFNANVEPRQAFQMGTYPEVPRSALEMIGLQNNEAESLTGIKAFNQGISGTALGDSVGGIRSAMDATAKRELGILRRLANCVVKIGHKIMKMNQVFLSDEEIIRVTNEPVMIKREELAGEFDVTLTISTPEADAEKARGLEFMLQTLGNSMPFEMTQIILSDIARLRKQPELSKRISEYQPEPDPLAQKKAELEIALLEAQVFNERNMAQENQADTALKMAKAQAEIAKTRSLHSKADIEDLDFIEKESGVHRQHEVNMKNLDSRNKNQEKLVDSMIADEQSAGAVGDDRLTPNPAVNQGL